MADLLVLGAGPVITAKITSNSEWCDARARLCARMQGTYGWRAHSSVKAYQSYERGQPPPEPEGFQPELLNASQAKMELSQLGIRV